jgi:hypothetical protein
MLKYQELQVDSSSVPFHVSRPLTRRASAITAGS